MLAVASVSAMAQDQDEMANDSLYLRVGVGANFAQDLDQEIAYDPAVVFVAAPPAMQTLALESRVTFAAAIGFDYADGIRTELEYRNASHDIETVTLSGGAGPATVTPGSDRFSLHFLMSNFYFDFYNDSAFTPFIGGGVGGAFATNETDQTDAALAYQARAGVSLAVAEASKFDLEFIYLRTNDLDFEPATPGPVLSVGEEPYVSSSAMLSFRQHF